MSQTSPKNMLSKYCIQNKKLNYFQKKKKVVFKSSYQIGPKYPTIL